MAATYPTAIDTLPKLLVDLHLSHPARLALRKKRVGYWHQYSWQDCYEHVRDCSLGLRELGLERGDAVCIIGDNDPEWLWSELAVQSAGAMVAGIGAEASTQQIRQHLRALRPKIVIARDQEQIDKLLAIREDLSTVRQVIYWDSKGMGSYDDPWLQFIGVLKEAGRRVADSQPERFETGVAEGRAGDTAIICLTAGTEGKQKGVSITYDALLGAYDNWSARAGVQIGDELFSFGPLDTVVEQSIMIPAALLHGAVINFPEQPGSVFADLVEVRPHFVVFPSVWWEYVHKELFAASLEVTGIKAWCYRQAVAAHPGGAFQILGGLAGAATRGLIRNKLGFGRLKSGFSTGSRLGPVVSAYFERLGVRVRNLYSLTEAGGTVSCQDIGDPEYSSAGKVGNRTKVMIAGDGEIVVQTSGAADGGVVYTGDIGALGPDGKLSVWGRRCEMIEAENGEPCSLGMVESDLRGSPFISDALVFEQAQQGNYSALIALERKTIARWAGKRRIGYANMIDLADREEVLTLVKEHIETVNAAVTNRLTVKDFILLPLGFDRDELTATGKLIRTVVMDRRLNKAGDGAKPSRQRLSFVGEDGNRGVD